MLSYPELQFCLVCRQWSWRILLGLICLGVSSAAQAQNSRDLANLLPQDINALAIVRVEQVMQTPRARQEEWAKSTDEKFLSGAGGIPSWIQTLVVGFQVRPATSEEVWAAGVASVPPAVTMDLVSLHERQPIEQLNGMAAVRSPRNSYLLGISPGILGIWRPAVRQEAGRWARALKARVTGPLSEYLTNASELPGHLVLAIDLENALDPVNTQAHLAANPQLAKSSDLQSQLQSLLMSVRGVQLSVTIGETTTANLQVDFQQEVGSLAPHVQQFFLNTLHDLGATIEDFDSGTYRAEGKSLKLTSAVSDESLLRLVSLVASAPSSPGMNPELAGSNAGTSPDVRQANAADSSRYFQQVDRYLQDLSKANRRATDYSRTALWHENFASKIDELSLKGVDPALVDYGSDVSSKLRALGRSLRGQQLDVNLQQGTLTYNYNYDPGWASMNVWGGFGYGAPSYQVTSNLQEVRQRQAAAISEGAAQRDDIWTLLTDERVRILRQMQQKYGADFGKQHSGKK